MTKENPKNQNVILPSKRTKMFSIQSQDQTILIFQNTLNFEKINPTYFFFYHKQEQMFNEIWAKKPVVVGRYFNFENLKLESVFIQNYINGLG